MAGHTPLPWKVEPEPTGSGEVSHYIREADADPAEIIACIIFSNEAEANAHFIVRACTSHAELLACVTEAIIHVGNTGAVVDRAWAQEWWERAKQAVRKATEA